MDLFAECLGAFSVVRSALLTPHPAPAPIPASAYSTAHARDGPCRLTSVTDRYLQELRNLLKDSKTENKAIFLELASGRGTDAHRNLVLVNAAHALLLADLALTLQGGYALATKTLASGAVLRLFEQYRDLTHAR